MLPCAACATFSGWSLQFDIASLVVTEWHGLQRRPGNVAYCSFGSFAGDAGLLSRGLSSGVDCRVGSLTGDLILDLQPKPAIGAVR